MPYSSQRRNIKNIRKGSRQACEAFICQHYGAIYNFMVYLTANPTLAEDITQETFAAAWANLDNFRGRASVKTWLHQIAYYKFIDSQRRLKRDSNLLANLKQQTHDASQTSSPLHQLITDECSSTIYRAMNELSSNEYLMLVLHYVQGLSFRQMSKIVDEPTGTVKWRTNTALNKLRKILTGRI